MTTVDERPTRSVLRYAATLKPVPAILPPVSKPGFHTAVEQALHLTYWRQKRDGRIAHIWQHPRRDAVRVIWQDCEKEGLVHSAVEWGGLAIGDRLMLLASDWIKRELLQC